MDLQYGRAPPGERKVDWVREKLLVPRRERGLKPLLAGYKNDEDDEERIVREAEAANSRLKASGLDRCPTGRLPGLGTLKSEKVLLKQQKVEAEAEAAERKRNAEKVFVEWLKRKQESGETYDAAAEEQKLKKAEQQRTAERKRLAEQKFTEWKAKKDRERRERRKQEDEARAAVLAEMLAMGPNQSSTTETKSPTSQSAKSSVELAANLEMNQSKNNQDESEGSPCIDPALPPQARSPINGVPNLKQSDMKWARVYLDKPIPRPPPQAGAAASPQNGERTLLRQCLQRLSRWLAKPQYRFDFEDALHRADQIGNGQLTEELEYSILHECGFKIGAYEHKLLHRHIENHFHGQCQRLVKHLIKKREQREKVSAETKKKHSAVSRANLSTRGASSRGPGGRKRRPSAARRKAAARRVVHAMNCESVEGLQDILQRAASNAAQAVANPNDLRANLDSFLAETELRDMSELLDKDLNLLCNLFMEDEFRQLPKSTYGLLVYLGEIADVQATSAGEDGLQVQITEDVRQPLQALFQSISDNPTRACVANLLTNCHEMKAIKGTVLVELLTTHGASFIESLELQTMSETNSKSSDANKNRSGDDSSKVMEGLVPEEEFVNYFYTKYEQYQRESMAKQSPTMCPTSTRPHTSRTRSRQGKPQRHRTSSSPSRIRLVKPPRYLQEAKAERDRNVKEAYTSGEEQYIQERHKPRDSYVAQQTVHEHAKSAAKSLGSVTSVQVVEVLNLEKPSKEIMQTVGAACLLVGFTPTWKHARALFKHWPNFLAFASSVTTTHVPTLDEETMNKLAKAVAPLSGEVPRLVVVLHKWVAAMHSLLKMRADIKSPKPSDVVQIP